MTVKSFILLHITFLFLWQLLKKFKYGLLMVGRQSIKNYKKYSLYIKM